MQNDKLEFLWAQRYRPTTIADCILPDALKTTFQGIASGERVPSLLLTGGAGVGKTTVAMALCDEVGADWILINASNENGIDTLRTKVSQFATTVSFTGAKKVVVLDEADSMTPNMQTGLRAFVEDVSKNTTFILTANYKNKIIEPLQSRFTPIDFKIKSSEKPQLAAQFMRRAGQILDLENVTYDKRVLAEIIQKHFPDFRRILNELQRYGVNGSIDTGALANQEATTLTDLLKSLKAKKFQEVRKWVAQNSDIETTTLYHEMYVQLSELVEPKCIPDVVLILARYGYQDAFVVDHEINTVAALVELMQAVVWK